MRRQGSQTCENAGAHNWDRVVGAGPDLAGGRPGDKRTWGVTRQETVKALGLKIQD